MTLDQLIEELDRYRREHPGHGDMRVKVQVLAHSPGALGHPMAHPLEVEAVDVHPFQIFGCGDRLVLGFRRRYSKDDR
jgi:hypothetical protein